VPKFNQAWAERTVGILKSEVTEMNVTEPVEERSGPVVSPAKLTGTVKLKNTSANRTVRVVAGKIQYIDAQGQPIELGEARTEPTLRPFSYGAEGLYPSQDASQSLDADFPAETLKANRLREIRLAFTYIIPSRFQEETVDFTVTMGESK
jgi:hypothetical protein